MNRKCEWCGRYHDERYIYSYYRDEYRRTYKSYHFCSTACKFHFSENTDLTKVGDNGLTPKENAIEVKRRDQEIKDQYGSWENYKRILKQKEKERKRGVILTKLFLWLVCPLILILFYKMGMSFLKLIVFGMVWLAVTVNYNEDNPI